MQQLAALGSNRQQITTLLDIDACALNEANPQRFDAAFQQGRAEGVAAVFDALMRNAIAGDPRAVAFVQEQMIEPQANGRAGAPLVVKLAGV